MSYTSGNPETKSASERWIRVAAIVIVISEGTWNICTAGRRKETDAFPVVANKDPRYSRRLTFRGE
jgi:hypothetical protein